MKLVPLASLAALLAGVGGCTAPICPANAARAARAVSTQADAVAGVVRDSEGQPVRARVAVVHASGSTSVGTLENGAFEIRGCPSATLVVCATTADGRLAIRSGVQAGATRLELIVEPAAAIVVHSDQARDVRCALFQGGVRFEDFTLRVGQPARVVVPEGTVRVQLYTPNETVAERELHLTRGEQRDVDLASVR